MKLRKMQFSPVPLPSSLSVPNISLSATFSSIPKLCYSLDVRDQVSHPYRAEYEIKVAHVLSCTLSDIKGD